MGNDLDVADLRHERSSSERSRSATPSTGEDHEDMSAFTETERAAIFGRVISKESTKSEDSVSIDGSNTGVPPPGDIQEDAPTGPTTTLGAIYELMTGILRIKFLSV